jgi:hypothetical protein
MKLKLSKQIFKKYSNIKFHENLCELFHPERWTDRNEGNSYSWQFCKHVKLASQTQTKTLQNHNRGTSSPNIHFTEGAVIPVHTVLQALFSLAESF